MDAWFIFKGKKSTDFGIKISEMPSRTSPILKQQTIQIDGMSGELTEYTGGFESYTMSFECGTRGSDKLDEIASWLNGSGDLIISNEPDKVYKAKVSTAVSISDVIYLYTSFLLQFRVQPLKYSANMPNDEIELTQGTAINNRGNYQSAPSITIYGTGDVVLSVNDKLYGIVQVEDSVTINSEIQEVYKDMFSLNNNFVADDFPTFEVGENQITWTGDVQKVVIQPNWRWL